MHIVQKDKTQYAHCAKGSNPICRLYKKVNQLTTSCLVALSQHQKNIKKSKREHWKLGQYNGMFDCKKGYKHQPEPKTEAKEAPILSDFADGRIRSNRSDKVVKDYKRKTYFLIDMTVPADNSLSVKEYDK